VTEKLFKVLTLDIIPVVFGSANYSKIAPQKSYINAQEFKSPKQLAEYLLYLDKNSTAYAEYFEWKSYLKVNRFYTFFCQLCIALNDETLPVQTYPDLEKWWLTDSHCITNITFPWLTNKS
jgi:hypothetical protein